MLETLMAATITLALVTHDQTPLRAAPKASAPLQAQLWQGEALEIRGSKMDYVQVYDYRRERGGYVRGSQLKTVTLAPENAQEILSVMRFLRDSPGSEALGIAFAAAYIQAAPPVVFNGETGVETLDALGTMADRLARRASAEAPNPKAAQATAEHLEVASRHGVRFTNNDRDGRIVVCYEGDAFRRVLAMKSTPEQRARAALGLTRPECMPEGVRAAERRLADEWRAEVLDKVTAEDLPGPARNRVLIRRAAVWSALAYQRARANEMADTAGARALLSLGGVDRSELAEDDSPAYTDAAMRVNASRWALANTPRPAEDGRPSLRTQPGQPGETCVLLVDAKNGPDKPLARRCTYGHVWAHSATLNREGNALVVAVQPTDAWREMWAFHKAGREWTVRILPPAATSPNVGYAEFAGWVPGGKEVLVAREALGDGRYRKNFELVRLDTLATVRQAGDPTMLGAFQRWQDPQWKRFTVAVR